MMPFSLPPETGPVTRQRTVRGMATLLFCMILLASATTLIFTLTRTSLAEQAIITNEYRAETLRQECEAGLDYARGWLSRHQPLWHPDSGGGYIHSLALPADIQARPESVELHVDYLSHDMQSPFIRIRVQAGWIDTATGSRPYSMGQFVHYTAINGPAGSIGVIARIESVPGSWNDHD